ncbi:hypothetical protein M0Q50_06405 [bacterium]|jgi:hypothetical protein|nr:hypothetical protein [bacterium]
MIEPRVKDIIEMYKDGNLLQVYIYLTSEDMIVDPSTWSGNIKKMIENKQYESAKQIIELTAYKFLNLK